MTEKLYDKNAYLNKFEAHVISCTETASGFETILDKTAFFPEEGGQSCDTGYIENAAVTHVFIRGNEIVHITDAKASGRVSCTLNMEERFDKMQQHTGEHIVCGIVHRMYGYENVGFHLGDSDVTFDFDGFLTRAQLDEVERLANRAVQANLTVRGYYPTKDELSALEYRSKKDIDGEVRIVEIESTDVCACCAPHVSKTGEIGLIKFTDSAAYKGGIRIHMVCGMRALADYDEKQKNLESIAKALSCNTNNAAEFFEKYAGQTQALKLDLGAMKKELISLRAAAVEKTDGSIVLFEDGLDMNMLRLMINALHGKYGGICAVFSKNDSGGYGFSAASDCIDMTEVAKQMRTKLSAKCGGGSQMIQGTVCAERETLENILKNI